MIRAHRERHRKLFLVLAPAAFGLLFASVLVKPQLPPPSDLPVPIAQAAAWVETPGNAKRVSVEPRSSGLVLEVARQETTLLLRALEPVIAPEVLLYWSPTGGEVPAALAAEAELAGRLGGTAWRAYPWRADADLVLYANGRSRILGVVPAPRLAATTDED